MEVYVYPVTYRPCSGREGAPMNEYVDYEGIPEKGELINYCEGKDSRFIDTQRFDLSSGGYTRRSYKEDHLIIEHVPLTLMSRQVFELVEASADYAFVLVGGKVEKVLAGRVLTAPYRNEYQRIFDERGLAGLDEAIDLAKEKLGINKGVL